MFQFQLLQSLLIAILSVLVVLTCGQPFRSPFMGSGRGGPGHMQGNHHDQDHNHGHGKKHGKNEREIVQGVWVDTSDKFIQRVTPQGTIYIPYATPMAKPQFRRRIQDTGRHFILFPDIHHEKGSGYYILLRHWNEHGALGEHGEPLYQAYKLWLSDSARSAVLNWPKEGEGARGQKGHEDSKEEKHHHHHDEEDSKKEHEDIDVGDAVNRKRREESIRVPPFSQIQISVRGDDGDAVHFSALTDSFDGFSIEREE